MAMTEIYYFSEPGNSLAVGKPVAGSAAQPGPPQRRDNCRRDSGNRFRPYRRSWCLSKPS